MGIIQNKITITEEEFSYATDVIRKQSMKENIENQKMMDKWSGYDGDNTIHDENYDWEAKTW